MGRVWNRYWIAEYVDGKWHGHEVLYGRAGDVRGEADWLRDELQCNQCPHPPGSAGVGRLGCCMAAADARKIACLFECGVLLIAILFMLC